MDRTHELGHVIANLVAFVNTAPECGGQDLLATEQDAADFVRDWKISDVEQPTGNEFMRLRRLRESFRQIFLADGKDRIDLINALLAVSIVTPRIADHDGLGPHVHYFPRHSSLSEHLAADCAVGLALLVTSGEGERLKVCASPDCRHVFYDLSRNRSRVYCDSKSCGNRVHAAAYRSRKRLESGARGPRAPRKQLA